MDYGGYTPSAQWGSVPQQQWSTVGVQPATPTQLAHNILPPPAAPAAPPTPAPPAPTPANNFNDLGAKGWTDLISGHPQQAEQDGQQLWNAFVSAMRPNAAASPGAAPAAQTTTPANPWSDLASGNVPNAQQGQAGLQRLFGVK
jgi:hypothetical protein